jgi:hypothetical protein
MNAQDNPIILCTQVAPSRRGEFLAAQRHRTQNGGDDRVPQQLIVARGDLSRGQHQQTDLIGR